MITNKAEDSIRVIFGIFCPGSPFYVDMEDATRVSATGKCLDASPIDKIAEFRIDPSKAPYRANAFVKITGIKVDGIMSLLVAR